MRYSPTSYDAQAVSMLADEQLTGQTKGVPLEAGSLTVAELVHSRASVIDGDLPMPLLVLQEEALAENIGVMARYCERHGALLAPHGKTTMAPQLFARQIDAGAWAITLATPTQLRVARDFGIQRLLLANQLVERAAIRWLCDELRRDVEFEFICLVDSVEAVELLQTELRRFGAPRSISVLLEVGYHGGRCGVRNPREAARVARAVATADLLDLVGVEAFEGLNDGGTIEKTLELVDSQLTGVVSIFEELLRQESFHGLPLISAGGSAYFDRVIAAFSGLPAKVVLRSGCYVSNDGGFYARMSPLAGRGGGSDCLRDAIELWSVVLSRPEAGLVIAGFGKRDAPYDMGLPIPRQWWREGASETAVGAEIERLSDQHAGVRIPEAAPVRVGDMLVCSISHPCGGFDRWRTVPIVDEAHRVTDIVLTRF